MEHGFSRVGVVGAGQMGHGIAQVAAQAGFDVMMQDISKEALELGRKKIEASTAKLVKKERLTEDERGNVLERIRTTPNLRDVAAYADLIVESALTGDPEPARRAVIEDPNSPPDEGACRAMFDELRRLQAEHLPF